LLMHPDLYLILFLQKSISFNKLYFQNLHYEGKQTYSNSGIDEIHYTADRALDGNRSTCSHTNQQTDPWWSVDLQDVYNISCISIYNFHQENKVTDISGAKIYIGNSCQNNGTNNKLVQNITAFLANQINVYEFPSSVSGRYVTVIRPENTFMVLCDVKITGTKMGQGRSVDVVGKAAILDLYGSKATLNRQLTNAERASDGNRSTCSLTLIHSSSWWRIDLQGVHNVSCVSIYNRNCSSLNVTPAKIYVGNSPKNGKLYSSKLLYFSSFQAYNITEFNTGQINVFRFPKSVFGRYVTVIRPGQKAMVLCDVNITGTALG
uniref:Fucolectin tachylectin-4 pentraxin-1 domain-containing protein n=1 Tax=Poecilia formosa TaxID=48698 RepID=A0A087YM42_POEFO